MLRHMWYMSPPLIKIRPLRFGPSHTQATCLTNGSVKHRLKMSFMFNHHIIYYRTNSNVEVVEYCILQQHHFTAENMSVSHNR